MIDTNLLNKIHNIDCFEILAQLPDESIDAMIIDPPYNNTALSYDLIKFPHERWFAELLRVAKPNCNIVLFASGKFHYKLWSIGEKYHRYDCIWDKYPKVTNGLSSGRMPLTQHEYVMLFTKKFHKDRLIYNHGIKYTGKIYKCPNAQHSTFGNKTASISYIKENDNNRFPTTVIRINKQIDSGNGANECIHPSEKPFKLIKYLVEMYSNENMVVLDTCSGSGVLADVCLHTNRKFICTEIDKEFYDKSIKRLQYHLEYEQLDTGAFIRK
jgi:site-specific DNA-methyltransferase (adenine-specific)